jgi:ribosomal protein S18 acetylase RimI-like enzyme
MLFRLAKGSDAEELCRLNDCFNGTGCNAIDSIRQSIIDNEREIVFVADSGEGLIGFCCGQEFKSMCYSSEYAEITELYVMEAFRREGVGRQLLIATENELRKRGVKHFRILTGNDNKAAHSLYSSHDYNLTSEILFEKDYN